MRLMVRLLFYLIRTSSSYLLLLCSCHIHILYRKKIPHACKSQRNCQLFIVVAAVVVTLATSFQPNVDWAAHIGGAIQVTKLTN